MTVYTVLVNEYSSCATLFLLRCGRSQHIHIALPMLPRHCTNSTINHEQVLAYRPAIIDSIARAEGCQARLSAVWWAEHGWKLPVFAFVIAVKLSEDGDAEVHEVPSCCVLSASGLNDIPVTSADSEIIEELRGKSVPRALR